MAHAWPVGHALECDWQPTARCAANGSGCVTEGRVYPRGAVYGCLSPDFTGCAGEEKEAPSASTALATTATTTEEVVRAASTLTYVPSYSRPYEPYCSVVPDLQAAVAEMPPLADNSQLHAVTAPAVLVAPEQTTRPDTTFCG